MKKIILVLCSVFCLAGCTTVAPKEPQEEIKEVIETESVEEKVVQVARSYYKLDATAKINNVDKVDQESIKEASKYFTSEVNDDNIYLVDIEVEPIEYRTPSNRVLLVSATTYEVVGALPVD